MMNFYLSSLEELYLHPDNGKPGIYLAAFLSADKTYPIFVTKVTRGTSGDYVGWAVGMKWGYDSPDTMSVTWWGDASMARDVHHQFFFWHEVSEYRFEPQGQAVPMPLAIQVQCHFLPLKMWEVTYSKEEEIAEQGEDNAWRYTAIATAISFPHALWQLRQQVPDTCNIRHTEITRPQILTDVWSD